MKESFSSQVCAVWGFVLVCMALIASLRGDHVAAAILFSASYLGFVIDQKKVVRVEAREEEAE